MKTAILAIILFCIMIFPHELGHYIAAKKCGVKVNEFAFGMGPVIWKKQKGETLHSIRLFPIGGFCAMEGEDEDSTDERAFGQKKPWQKIIILAAGSLMNLACAIVIMCLIAGIYGFTTTTLGEVESGSPAALAGLEPNDKIVSVTTDKVYKIEAWNDISTAINTVKDGQSVSVEYEREGKTHAADIKPTIVNGVDAQGNTVSRYVLGITCKISHNPAKAAVAGVQSTWNLTKMMFSAIGQLFTGKVGADELTGPVGMVQMVSQTTKYGVSYYASLVALICINLAIVNMLPLPALDGGRIIFVLYSAITKKPVSEKVEGIVHLVGLALLMMLMVYVTFNDVLRIFD